MTPPVIPKKKINMKRPSTRLVFDRKKVATKERKGLVQIELCMDRKRKWISTGVKVYADQWDERMWVVRNIDAKKMNDELYKAKSDVEDFLLSFSEDNPFSWEKVDVWVKRRNETPIAEDNFVEYCRKRIADRKDIRDTTRKTQAKLVKSLEKFGRITFYTDLNKQNITLYDEWLHGEGYEQQTISTYIKTLKTYVNDAIRAGLIREDPFLGLKFARGESKVDRYLTEDEVKRIMDKDMPTQSLNNVRDLFVVQCYTGLAYADLMSVDFTGAVKHGKHFVLTSDRQKTGKRFYIVLLTPVMEILRRHDFQLPKMTNQQYNMRLKVVAENAGIDKPVSSHWGRRTCGYLLLNHGISIEIVARMLGHANIQTTQKVYAKILDRTMDAALMKFDRKKFK